MVQNNAEMVQDKDVLQDDAQEAPLEFIPLEHNFGFAAGNKNTELLTKWYVTSSTTPFVAICFRWT